VVVLVVWVGQRRLNLPLEMAVQHKRQQSQVAPFITPVVAAEALGLVYLERAA
jgi:hypothetical protein